MVEIVGKESDAIKSAILPEDVFPRTEDPENKLSLKERIRLLPCFPGSYEYAVNIY